MFLGRGQTFFPRVCLFPPPPSQASQAPGFETNLFHLKTNLLNLSLKHAGRIHTHYISVFICFHCFSVFFWPPKSPRGFLRFAPGGMPGSCSVSTTSWRSSPALESCPPGGELVKPSSPWILVQFSGFHMFSHVFTSKQLMIWVHSPESSRRMAKENRKHWF